MKRLLLQIRSPAALAAVLTLVLAAELLPSPPLQPTPVFAGHTPAAAADDSAAEAQSWATIILARPLFQPDRRPLSVAAVAASETEALPPPRLTAIVITAARRSAIFSDGGSSSDVLGVGGHSGAYEVVAISPDSVRLSGPNGPLTLYPEYASGAPLVASSGN